MLQVSFDNSQDDPNAMFSIKRIPIPLARLNAKGKVGEPVNIHTVIVLLMDCNV